MEMLITTENCWIGMEINTNGNNPSLPPPNLIEVWRNKNNPN